MVVAEAGGGQSRWASVRAKDPEEARVKWGLPEYDDWCRQLSSEPKAEPRLADRSEVRPDSNWRQVLAGRGLWVEERARSSSLPSLLS